MSRMLVAFVLVGCSILSADEPLQNRPKVPGELRLNLRERKEIPNAEKVRVVEREEHWKVSETAIIVCDMWDDHYCKSAARRVSIMVPKMNRVLEEARSRGVMIIHAPSGTMNVYDQTPFRKRMKLAPTAATPVKLLNWCYLDESREAAMPVDTSKCACDDAVVGDKVRRFSRQHPGLDIVDYDGVSDNGQEIFNFCEQEGIKNIAIMGVHTNMCVLGRPFGIRQNVRLGRNIVLVRDLTDSMYDPRQPPYVSHARGTQLVVQHIERYWCPSIESGDLTRLLSESGPSSEAEILAKATNDKRD